jgi:hypothetical protein
MLTATGAIGTAGSPLETSSPGTLTLAASGDGVFLDNNTALQVNYATGANRDVSISAAGNLTLLGSVGSAGNVMLTATDGTLTTSGNTSISAASLTIGAEQIGSTSDIIQTVVTAINATANYGGIYLSNSNTDNLTLSAAAVGPVLNAGTTTNNIDIYSAGNIVLLPQTSTLTQLVSPLPVAILNPGGTLTLLAGETLSVDGKTALTESGSATVTSADAGNKTTTYYDVYTGTYDINGATQFNDNFNSSNSGGLDSNWTVQVGSFTVNSTSQTTTGTDTSDINLATVNSINSVNESVSATISGTLASGQTAGLVALFNSTGRFYYGSIVATSSSTYRASIYSVFGGETPLVEQSYTGSVSNAVLEFTVAGSSLTLLLNDSVVASTTITSASAGVVGILASSGVSFSNFSSSPSLQIQGDTATGPSR